MLLHTPRADVYTNDYWYSLNKDAMKIVPFDLELVTSKDYIGFKICLGNVKVPISLMFWQNLDRLRHKIEEMAYVPHDEWVKILFSDGYGDPINSLSLRVCGAGKIIVFMDCECNDSYICKCDEREVIEKLYTSLLEWTQLYDDSLPGLEGYENFYTRKEAYGHMKSPILEKYIDDLKMGRLCSWWRHVESTPEETPIYNHNWKLIKIIRQKD